MAVVNFQRGGDAAEARRKYNGKIIDGRKSRMLRLVGCSSAETERHRVPVRAVQDVP
jgi:hypothetical protein